MKRNDESKESLVYAYGCIPPSDNQHVMAEILRQRQMWDALVEADRAHDRRVDAVIRETCQEYVEASAALDAAWTVLKAALDERNAIRAKTRSLATAHDDTVKVAVAARNEARAKVWALAKAWMKENREKLRDLEQQRREANKAIRQQSGLYWANYNRVLDDFETGRKTAMKKGRRMRPTDYSREDGCLTVQIQRTKSGLGAAAGELRDGTYNQLQIGPTPEGVENLPATRRSRECKVDAVMRVDAAGHTVTFPVWFHRPLPLDCRVKGAQLVWKREGERIVGKLCLTISRERADSKSASRIACGVDLGWRIDNGGLRVATVLAISGAVTHHHLPADWMRGMDQVERLAQHIDEGLIEVGKFIHEHDDLPVILRNPAACWRPGLGSRHIDAGALHDAVRSLNWNVPAEILHWYKRYRHLNVWRDNLRAKLLRRRRELFRLLAREIATAHAVIGIEDMDLSLMARTKKRDDASDNELHAMARANRVRACVHSLRAEIEHQARKHGCEIVYATAHTTQRCRACGGVTSQEDRAALVWKCEHCGSEWDQDQNAAGNLLAVAVGAASAEVAQPSHDAGSMDYAPIEARIHKRSRIEPWARAVDVA